AGELSFHRPGKCLRGGFVGATIQFPDDETSAMLTSKVQHTGTGPGQVLLALGAGAALGFGWVAEDWIASGWILLVLLLALRGFHHGGAALAASVLAMLAAFRWSASLAPLASTILPEFVAVPASHKGFVDLAVSGLSIALCVYIAVRIFAMLIFAILPGLTSINRWIGGLLGALQGGLLGALVLFAGLVLEPAAARQIRSDATPSGHPLIQQLSGYVVTFVQRARRSSIRPVLAAMDPLKRDLHQRAQQMAKTISLRTVTDPGTQAGLEQMAQDLRHDEAALHDFATQFGLDEASVRAVLESSDFQALLRDSSRAPGAAQDGT
ncbi:MAG TPA: CvpA family protein, partial [Pirellulaceae bacterium]